LALSGTPKMRVQYDPQRKCLLCFKDKQDFSSWDDHWSKVDISQLYASLSRYNLILRVTKKYLKPEDGPILEGGCGIGQFVYSLCRAGFRCVGVDAADKTINIAKKANPTLNLQTMDVRELKFPDDYFAGYWSLGVIEHFADGYDEALAEMVRVVKPEGFVFVTVPIMSLIRTIKAVFGVYELVNRKNEGDLCETTFYQYVLPQRNVIKKFARGGLRLVEMRRTGGIKGLSDEISVVKSLLKSAGDLRRKSLALKVAYKLLDTMLCLTSGHMGLFVFKKLKEDM